MTKPDGPLTKAGILDYSGGGRISVNVDKLVQTEGFRRQLEWVKAMTDKAAREAFATELARVGTDSKFYTITAEQWYIAGYQAAHDAAMAAEQHPWPFVNSPQAVADKMSDAFWLFEGDMLAALRHVFIEKQEPVTARIALQAAQQREAECRKQTIEECMVKCEWLGAAAFGRPEGFEDGCDACRNGIAALATQPTSKGETT